jgi:hypothetical protein
MSDKIWQMCRWIITRLLKILTHLTIAIVALLLWDKYRTRNVVWIDFIDNNISGKILVPQEITKTKDCERFFKWQTDNLPACMHGICPWYAYTPEREVIIGSLKLKIPRKYLALPEAVAKDADMITTKSFIYPSLALEDGYNSHDSFFFILNKDSEDDLYESEYQKYLYSFLELGTKYITYKIIPQGYE